MTNNRPVFCIFIAIIFLLVLHQILRNISDLTADLNCYISTEKRQALLDIFRKFQNSTDKHKVTCWLSFGGFIGAYRYENLLPWDKDIDVACLENQEFILRESVIPELKKQGISVISGKHYYRFQV